MRPNEPETQRLFSLSRDRVDSYLRVIAALMLRDMRTRFTGTYWGYVIQVLWPVTHILVIVAIMTFQKIPAPFGDSTMVFAATGAAPALVFQYISREIMKGIVTNKPLTYYPQVKTLDVVFSRIIVEIISSFLGIMLIIAVLIAFGADPIPDNIFTALCGYLCAVIFGISIGTINVAIVGVFPGWVIGYVVITILLYISSGVVFLPSNLPSQVYYYLKFNPLVQIVEWVRLGYDPGLPVSVDYTYLFLWVTGALTVGLLLERTYSRRAGI